MIQRQLKFRAFDDGKMIYHEMINVKEESHYHNIHYFFRTIREDAIVMQSTGLVDINNNEIYEGDVCKDKMAGIDYLCEIVFNKAVAAFQVKYIAHQGNVLTNTLFNDYIQVIGNIYENPELKVRDGKI